MACVSDLDPALASETPFDSAALLGDTGNMTAEMPVRTENLNPGVAEMESAQDEGRCDAPGPLYPR